MEKRKKKLQKETRKEIRDKGRKLNKMKGTLGKIKVRKKCK